MIVLWLVHVVLAENEGWMRIQEGRQLEGASKQRAHLITQGEEEEDQGNKRHEIR